MPRGTNKRFHRRVRDNWTPQIRNRDVKVFTAMHSPTRTPQLAAPRALDADPSVNRLEVGAESADPMKQLSEEQKALLAALF